MKTAAELSAAVFVDILKYSHFCDIIIKPREILEYLGCRR